MTADTITTPPATEQRRGDWIQTYTGRRFWPLDPRTADVCLDDVAHALSNLCRFTGHVKTFYSVAQHCVLASHAARPEAAMLALLHDAAEAYLGDIARPWKRFLHVHADGLHERLRLVEHRLLVTILNAFGVCAESWAWWDEVERVDLVLLATEKRDLLGAGPKWSHEYDGYEPLPERISPWTPGRASWEFRQRFAQLAPVTASRPVPAELGPDLGGEG